MTTEWFFPPNSGGEESGLNDAGIQFFRSSGALARETIQNSGDAAASPGSPVRVVFELQQIPASEIPDVAGLRDSIECCRKYMVQQCTTPEQRKQNGEEFFDRALALLAGEKIPVLRVGDYGTTGLEGSDTEKMTPWYRLLRTQGTSSMHGAGGGTFGIGQRAPFAYSALRTVFYSTRTRSGSGLIGKSILSTFEDGTGKKHRPVGYWGIRQPGDEGVIRVSNPSGMPARFRRDSIGTDLHILGYVHENWREDITRSVLCNFFSAILAGRLEVELRSEDEDPCFIGKDNLGEFLDREYAGAIAKADTVSEREEVNDTLGMTRHFVAALSAPHGGAPVVGQVAELGEVKLYLTLNEEAPSRIAFMRKPRILVHHRRQRMLKGYAAVFVCDSDEGNRLLAGLEDPSHREWDRARMPRLGDRITREINRFVRESLQQLIQGDEGEAQDVPDLWRYLPEEADDRAARGKGTGTRSGRVVPEETGTITPRKGKVPLVKRKPPRPEKIVGPVETTGETGEGDEQIEGQPERMDGGGDGGSGSGGGPMAGGSGEQGVPGTRLPGLRESDVRFRTFFDRDRGAVRLVLESRRKGCGDIGLTAVGEDSDYDVVIQSARDEATGAELPVAGGVLRDVILAAREPRRVLLTLEGDQHVALSAEVRRGR